MWGNLEKRHKMWGNFVMKPRKVPKHDVDIFDEKHQKGLKKVDIFDETLMKPLLKPWFRLEVLKMRGMGYS